jgi:diguanylate cyclase (GGDEF)-like protein
MEPPASVRGRSSAVAWHLRVRGLSAGLGPGNRAQEELRTSQERALHDELTGLPNRALLLDHLQAALTRAHRYGLAVALSFLDLDDVKAVHDNLGRQAEGGYLMQVGNRLAGTLRGSDTAADLGVDEFVVLCEDLCDPAEAGVLADRIQQTLAEKICLKGERVSASASIGVAIGSSDSTPRACCGTPMPRCTPPSAAVADGGVSAVAASR